MAGPSELRAPSPFLPLSQRQPSKLSTPEYTVELKGASLAWASKDKSSKKNVLEVSCGGGQGKTIRQLSHVDVLHSNPPSTTN